MEKKYNLTDEDIDFLFDFVKDSLAFLNMDNETILKQLKFTCHETILFPHFAKKI